MATHVPPPVGEINSISHFAAVAREPQPGRQLDLIRQAAPGFRGGSERTGMPDWMGTFDLVSLPYPTRFGLFRAAMSPAPYLSLTHRLMVVRWREPDGKPRVLLFEPTDVELARRTPYFARLRESTPAAFERAFARPARGRAGPSAQRRHRCRRRRLDHLRSPALAGRAPMARNHRARA